MVIRKAFGLRNANTHGTKHINQGKRTERPGRKSLKAIAGL